MVDESTDGFASEGTAKIADEVQRAFAEYFGSAERQVDTPLTVAEIASLDNDDDLDDRVWIRLSSLVDYRDASILATEDHDVCAYLSTRLFEWEVGNGGLHQYFFNFDDPDLLALVLIGYAHLGHDDVRSVVEELVLPVATAEAVCGNQFAAVVKPSVRRTRTVDSPTWMTESTSMTSTE